MSLWSCWRKLKTSQAIKAGLLLARTFRANSRIFIRNKIQLVKYPFSSNQFVLISSDSVYRSLKGVSITLFHRSQWLPTGSVSFIGLKIVLFSDFHSYWHEDKTPTSLRKYSVWATIKKENPRASILNLERLLLVMFWRVLRLVVFVFFSVSRGKSSRPPMCALCFVTLSCCDFWVKFLASQSI